MFFPELHKDFQQVPKKISDVVPSSEVLEPISLINNPTHFINRAREIIQPIKCLSAGNPVNLLVGAFLSYRLLRFLLRGIYSCYINAAQLYKVKFT